MKTSYLVRRRVIFNLNSDLYDTLLVVLATLGHWRDIYEGSSGPQADGRTGDFPANFDALQVRCALAFNGGSLRFVGSCG